MASYHHGDLPNALRAATVDVIGEVGLAGVSLREVARRAGVSHAAPAHHFGDRAGLLASVASEGFAMLSASLDACAARTDPIERVVALGRAYVRFAVDHPAHTAVMWRAEVVAVDGAAASAGADAFGHVVAAMEALAGSRAPGLDTYEAAMAAWLLVHGLAQVHDLVDPALSAATIGRDHTLGHAAPEDVAERMLRQLLDGLLPVDRDGAAGPGPRSASR